MQAIYGYDRSTLPCPDEEEYCHYTIPNDLLQDLGMNKPSYWNDVSYLLCVTILLRTAAFYALKFKVRVV